jgi:inner membrane protein
MVVLPLLLAGALWWFDRWQARRRARPEGRLPVRFGWLLALSVIGCLTHPLFDWFNNYGVRLLEPFSSQWFYGDTLFIIDPWIIAMLGAGVWFSLGRERASTSNWMRPARLGLAGLAGYVAFNLGISVLAAGQAAGDAPYAEINVANALPVTFWRREVLWRSGDGRFGKLDCTALSCRSYPLAALETNMADPRIAQWAMGDSAAQAFLFWSRMPIAELHGDHIILRDQRFMDPRTAAQFSVTLRPPR